MGIDAAISVVLALINNAAQISALIQKAQAAGTAISAEDWATITAADDAARKALVDAIAKA